MDEFFQLYTSAGDILWFEEPRIVGNQSAFSRYTTRPIERNAWIHGSNHRNMNKRVVEFLKKSWVGPVRIETIESDRERSHRHVMNERLRREKHKQSYLALHKLLPLGTKSEKRSILETAAKEIEELEKLKEELRRKTRVMEMSLGARVKEKLAVEKAEMKLKVAYPASGIDSMLEVLKCLKSTGSTAIAIRSKFSQHEFTAVLEVETKIRAVEVEKAVQRTLFEAERKFHQQFSEKRWPNS